MKKRYACFIAGCTMLLMVGIFLPSTPAKALSSYWKTAHWVTLTQDVTVDKVKSSGGSYVRSYTAKAGSHYKLNHWDVNYSWALASGRFKTNGKYTYTVDKPWNSSSWFKRGIHHISNYKSFHGYRIEGRKSLYNFNTFYDKPDHATISDYRPTQKSKIIFEYGSHVYPTKHEWDWMHGKWMTGYKYKNGAWKQISNDKIPE